MLIHLLLFAALLFLPGWLLSRILAPRLTGYLASFSASVALLMANIALFVHFRIPLAAFTPAIAVEILLLGAWFYLSVGAPVKAGYTLARILAHAKKEKAFHAGAGLTALTVLLYLGYAGIYTEIPADVWRHLGYIQWAYQAHEGSRALLPVHLWYYIPAWFRHLSGDDAFSFIGGFGAANTLVQGVGLYVFTYKIAQRLTAGETRAAAVAWLSVLIAAFSIGVNVFSYIRYYAFGPIFPNMLVYLYCILLTLEIFEQRRLRLDTAAVLGLLSITLYTVHDQEAAFLYTFVLSLSLVTIARYMIGWRRRAQQPARAHSTPALPGADLYIAGAVVVLTGLFFLYTHYTFPIRGAVLPWIVPLSGLIPTGIHLYIGNPSYQIFESLTIWGLFVYVLFLAHWNTFGRNLYIVSGMLIPVVTVFNPAFVDMFLRHSEAAPIYRFIYAVPLFIVASWCLVGYLASITRVSMVKKGAAAAASVLLIGLLFPTGLPVLHNPNTRAHTLAPVLPGNDYLQWRDMIEFLGTLGPSRVISDPVTAYLVRGLTHHSAPGYKFHQVHVPLDRDAGYYSGFTNALIVVNNRDGARSANGRRAGHWPEDVLEVSRYYPDSFERIMRADPERFELIWQRDRIRIYRIGQT